MTARFCSWCGHALESNARFCSQCGGRVVETVVVDGSIDSIDPMRGFDIVDGTPISADETVKIDLNSNSTDETTRIDTKSTKSDLADIDTVILPTDNYQKKFTAEEPKKGNKALAVCIVIIIILLAAVVALGFMQVRDTLLW